MQQCCVIPLGIGAEYRSDSMRAKPPAHQSSSFAAPIVGPFICASHVPSERPFLLDVVCGSPAPVACPVSWPYSQHVYGLGAKGGPDTV